MSYDKLNTLHEELTELMMNSGAAITKTSIDALVGFIANRDKFTMQRVIKDAENRLHDLQNDPYFGAKQVTPQKD